MKVNYTQQRSIEWHEFKNGKIGGTRLSKVISGVKNRLIFDLINEQLSGYIAEDSYIDEDIQFGIDNESIARDLYSEQSGIEFIEVGCIVSETSDIHLASPDGLNIERGIALEIKCTQNGAIHLERYFNGVEKNYMSQVINYFVVSDDVEQVHWLSYCPYRPERPLIPIIFLRDSFQKEIDSARRKIAEIEKTIEQYKSDFIF